MPRLFAKLQARLRSRRFSLFPVTCRVAASQPSHSQRSLDVFELACHQIICPAFQRHTEITFLAACSPACLPACLCACVHGAPALPSVIRRNRRGKNDGPSCDSASIPFSSTVPGETCHRSSGGWWSCECACAVLFFLFCFFCSYQSASVWEKCIWPFRLFKEKSVPPPEKKKLKMSGSFHWAL